MMTTMTITMTSAESARKRISMRMIRKASATAVEVCTLRLQRQRTTTAEETRRTRRPRPQHRMAATSLILMAMFGLVMTGMILQRVDSLSARATSKSSKTLSTTTFLRIRRVEQITSTSSAQVEAANKKQNNSNNINSDSSNSSKNKNQSNNVPGYNFFQGDGTGYVPSGMSKEEYAKLRQRELKEALSKNYGAWGPSWSQSNAAPQGDWMVMPSLWTNGFGANNDDPRRRPTGNGGDLGGSSPPSLLNKIRRTVYIFTRFVKANFAGFMLGYLVVDTLSSCYLLWKMQQLTLRAAMWRLINTVIWNQFNNKSHLHPNFHPHHLSTSPSILAQVYTIKVVVALLLAPFMNVWLERQNRRNLWTKSKTASVTALIDVCILLLWTMVLMNIPK